MLEWEGHCVCQSAASFLCVHCTTVVSDSGGYHHLNLTAIPAPFYCTMYPATGQFRLHAFRFVPNPLSCAEKQPGKGGGIHHLSTVQSGLEEVETIVFIDLQNFYWPSDMQNRLHSNLFTFLLKLRTIAFHITVPWINELVLTLHVHVHTFFTI
jgi:hypothetical protein